MGGGSYSKGAHFCIAYIVALPILYAIPVERFLRPAKIARSVNAWFLAVGRKLARCLAFSFPEKVRRSLGGFQDICFDICFPLTLIVPTTLTVLMLEKGQLFDIMEAYAKGAALHK
jgi:hypothetical protein